MKMKEKAQEKARNSFKKVPCVIGFDQSYTRTGISIAVNGKLKKVTSEPFKGLTNKSLKRIKIGEDAEKVIQSCLKKFDKKDVVIIVERIRTYTASYDVRPDFLKSQGALIAVIVDVAYRYGIKVYSVDTRCWKTAILGTSKPVFEPIEGVKDPQNSVQFVRLSHLGLRNHFRSGEADQMQLYL